ncbi:hypothetical protein AYY19_11255 [Photobacterium aquimaris]|uniref:hypothetical protein n=1 Tax=Photobacterium aquimaris TaxID=512643 RepID=UPI0007EFAD7A|nr:hypothetical protein [Photobacterium aquimaris]OBU18015.1 hypothetical protein AYY19_11255 [Photobacterium aquimaris]
MRQRTFCFIPLIVLLTTSTAAHAESALNQLHQVNKQLSHLENTVNGTQKKYSNTQRSIKEVKNGTYVEKSVERAVKRKKRKAVNSLINHYQ